MLRIALVKAMGQPPSQALAADFSDAGGVIGRASSCTLHLPDPYQHISREQVKVIFEGGEFFVVVCGIPNVVSLNGQELAKDEPRAVRSGDLLTVGEFELSLENAAPEQTTKTPAPLESPTQFWNSLASPAATQGNAQWPQSNEPSKGLGHATASDPFANLFNSVPVAASASLAATGAASSSAVPPNASNEIPDDFDIWGDLPSAKAQSSDPFTLGPVDRTSEPLTPASRAVEAPSGRAKDKAEDLLGLGQSSSERGGLAPQESIDDLFGLGNSRATSSMDPLGLMGAKQKNHSLTHDDLGQFGGILNQPKGHLDAPLADQTPEIYGTFNLPQSKQSPASNIKHPVQEIPESLSLFGATAVPSTIPVLPAAAIQDIAAQVAADHPFFFDDTPQTQATDLLDGLNQQSMKAQLKQSLEKLGPNASSQRPAAGSLSRAQAAVDAHAEVNTGIGRTPQAVGIPLKSPSDSELLAGFLRGLKLDKLPRTALSHGQPDAGLTPELMERIGGMLRISTQSTLDLLAARSVLKREMKTEVTMIVSQDNNPLKFSPDSESALAHLLSPIAVRGFLSPEDSVQDAFDDLTAHQMAFVAGMRAAIQSLVLKFDPQSLESRLTKKSMIESVVPATRKAKLWERFSELYAEISREAEDDFEAFFGKEFVKAYENQVNKLDLKNKRS